MTILFDGVCNLCHGFVRFVLARDRRAQFRFASLQSEAARVLLHAHGLNADQLNSVVLVADGRVWQKSDAALEITRHLDGIWSWGAALRVFPRPLRDAVYDWVARNRYHWFGRKDACPLPDPALVHRFLG